MHNKVIVALLLVTSVGWICASEKSELKENKDAKKGGKGSPKQHNRRASQNNSSAPNLPALMASTSGSSSSSSSSSLSSSAVSANSSSSLNAGSSSSFELQLSPCPQQTQKLSALGRFANGLSRVVSSNRKYVASQIQGGTFFDEYQTTEEQISAMAFAFADATRKAQTEPCRLQQMLDLTRFSKQYPNVEIASALKQEALKVVADSQKRCQELADFLNQSHNPTSNQSGN